MAGNIHDRAYYEEKFFNWLQEHKVQVTHGEHFVRMLQNFANNDDFISTHNAGNHAFTLGHNRFSHMNRDEWKAYLRTGLSRPTSSGASSVHTAPKDTSSLPDAVDWVSLGAVTGVKDQGQCGSCWSFSTTGALEGAYKNKWGTLKSFSEQNLVDCDNLRNGGTDHGCNGGWMDDAFNWVKKNGGLAYENDYTYVSGTSQTANTCVQEKYTKDPKVTPSGYVDVAANSDAAFMSALAQQPLSIAIEADQTSFQLYKSGVFTGACGATLDHGVLAVGYGTDSTLGLDFYKVKNSWGTGWGEGGYIRLVRGNTTVNDGAGQCGILSAASYPVM